LPQKNVADRIRGYFGRVEDIQYLEDILAEVPWPELFQTLLQLIQSLSADDFAKADLFVCDVICRTTNKIQFRQQFFAAGLATVYVQNTFVRNFFIRRTALGTLKTYFYYWWPQGNVEKAVEFYESNDPILLAELTKYDMRHHRWEDWSLPKRLVKNPDYLVRWSIMEAIEPIMHFPLPQEEILSQIKSCLEVLQRDVNDAVRAEADFLCLQIVNYEKMLSLPKLEKRKLSKAMDKVIPKIRFDSLRDFVGIELYKLGKVDFTMSELHEFADAFQKLGN
jgi:hypothetical protein